MGRAGLALLLILCVATVWVAGGVLEGMAAERRGSEELLYLPNGKHLRMMSLGQASLLADVFYIWAIQYYSNYEREDRYRYVEHVFGEVIAELDPHYVDAYWLGALILTVEARDLDAGLRLLDQGFAANPDKWILPYLAAWESYRAGEVDRAAAYFARAAGVPGAPYAVRRMQAGMVQRAGELGLALQLWREIRDDPASDAASAAIAGKQVRNLEIRIDLERLQHALQAFRNDNGRFPNSLEELRRRSYIDIVPRDPGGGEYPYDPRTGRVGTIAGRVLGDAS
jgi:tetratricopeptide (TPR) repeat protein